jgi:hypothetical protein
MKSFKLEKETDMSFKISFDRLQLRQRRRREAASEPRRQLCEPGAHDDKPIALCVGQLQQRVRYSIIASGISNRSTES